MDCQNQFKKTLNFHQFPQDTEHLEFQTSEGSIIRPGSEGGRTDFEHEATYCYTAAKTASIKWKSEYILGGNEPINKQNTLERNTISDDSRLYNRRWSYITTVGSKGSELIFTP